MRLELGGILCYNYNSHPQTRPWAHRKQAFRKRLPCNICGAFLPAGLLVLSYQFLFTDFLAVAWKGENALEKKPQKDDKRQNKLFLQGLSFLSQIGITMAACVLVGVFLGRFLDRLLDTSPWLLLLFSFLGAGAAFKSVFDLGRRK